MADIVIRGMEMPKTCQICRTAKFDRIVGCEEWDRLSIAQRMYMRSETCPLIPLPEGHGRLIDADKLTPDMGNYITGGSGTVGSMCTMRGYSQRKIDNAPTILEAEVKEDG